MPLSHSPGHAQCDFGEALVVIGGLERRAHCLVLDLPHSDSCFVKATPSDTTEAFLVRVPQSIPYHSTKLAVARPLERHWETDAGNVPRPSPNSSPTTCSRTGSGEVPAGATTRGRWKAWWAT